MCEPACTSGVDAMIAQSKGVLFSGGYFHQVGCPKGELLAFQIRAHQTRQKQMRWQERHAPAS